MRAEIITTGTEILLGAIVDINTSFLASELALLGIDIHSASSVVDGIIPLLKEIRQQGRQEKYLLITLRSRLLDS
jgi:nicotinamide-nucleotide amidase